MVPWARVPRMPDSQSPACSRKCAPLVSSGAPGGTATQVTQGYLPTVMAIRANELVVDLH